jgi:hypothetical protein
LRQLRRACFHGPDEDETFRHRLIHRVIVLGQTFEGLQHEFADGFFSDHDVYFCRIDRKSAQDA